MDVHDQPKSKQEKNKNWHKTRHLANSAKQLKFGKNAEVLQWRGSLCVEKLSRLNKVQHLFGAESLICQLSADVCHRQERRSA